MARALCAGSAGGAEPSHGNPPRLPSCCETGTTAQRKRIRGTAKCPQQKKGRGFAKCLSTIAMVRSRGRPLEISGAVDADLSSRWRDWKYHLGQEFSELEANGVDLESMKDHLPEDIQVEQWMWENAIRHFSKPEVKAACARNKKNRSSENYVPSLHGRKSMAQHRYPDDPTQPLITPLVIWEEKHKKKDGNRICDQARIAYDLMLEAMVHLTQETRGEDPELCGLTDVEQANTFTLAQMIDCMQQVLGYRRARILGVGRRLPSSISGASSTQPSRSSQHPPSQFLTMDEHQRAMEEMRQRCMAEQEQWQRRVETSLEAALRQISQHITAIPGAPLSADFLRSFIPGPSRMAGDHEDQPTSLDHD